MAYDADEIAALLPLPPATFHILVAVAQQDRHGYAIIQDVEARTGGELRLSPGTLYRSVQRMKPSSRPRGRPCRDRTIAPNASEPFSTSFAGR